MSEPIECAVYYSRRMHSHASLTASTSRSGWPDKRPASADRESPLPPHAAARLPHPLRSRARRPGAPQLSLLLRAPQPPADKRAPQHVGSLLALRQIRSHTAVDAGMFGFERVDLVGRNVYVSTSRGRSLLLLLLSPPLPRLTGSRARRTPSAYTEGRADAPKASGLPARCGRRRARQRSARPTGRGASTGSCREQRRCAAEAGTW